MHTSDNNLNFNSETFFKNLRRQVLINACGEKWATATDQEVSDELSKLEERKKSLENIQKMQEEVIQKNNALLQQLNSVEKKN